jgi:hypothetical protein
VGVVEAGRFTRLEPDPSHPTGQALCAKGRAAPELVYSRERLTHPLRRTRPKGDADPGWERISWVSPACAAASSAAVPTTSLRRRGTIAALALRGIAFVPDYLANAGGVIDFHQEAIDDQPDAVLASVARIGTITRDVLRWAASTGATPLNVADGIVQARIRRG